MLTKRNPFHRTGSTQERIFESEKDRVPIDKNIYYVKSKRKYYAVFYYGKDPDTGKLIKRTHTYSAERDARKALKDFEREKASDTFIAPKQDTLFTCIDNYIRAKEVAGREKATLSEYNKFTKHLHAYTIFENKPVQQITERDIIDYLQYLGTAKGLAANTRRKHFDFLKSVLNKAVRDRIIASNPIAYLEPPKKTPSCAKAMPEKLAADVIAKAEGTKVEPLVLLLALGMRREEVAGLRWEHVDLEKGLIHIREVRTEVNGVAEVKRPKTESSVHTIAIPPHYLSVFANIKLKQKNHNQPMRNMNHLYVVGKADGSPYSPNYLNDLVRKFEKENGLSHYRLHDYRHTAATLLHDAGTSLYDVSKFLGHSSVSITADLYTHQSDETNAAATAKLSAILSGGSSAQNDS